jgi:hypothetical protein
MRKLLISSFILLFFSCKSTYIERGNSSWHVQTNTQDQKNIKSEKQLTEISETTQQGINDEESHLLIEESPSLKADIKESFAPVKTQVSQLRKVIGENKNPLNIKKAEISKFNLNNNSITGYKTTGQKVGLYMMLASLLLYIVTLILFAGDWGALIFVALEVLFFILGLLVYLIASILK